MNKTINSNMKYYLAPMMGYTDCYLRNLAEKLYRDNIQTFSEMIVDKALSFIMKLILFKNIF